MPLYNRITKLRQKMIDQRLDAVLISSIPNIIYLTNYSNFSKDEREAFLLITKNGQFIFTDGRYVAETKKLVKYFKLIEISSSFNFYNALKEITLKQKIKTLGIEETDICVSEFNKLEEVISELKSANLNNLRITKTSLEIEKIKKACLLGDKAFEYILEEIKPGLSEKQLAYLLENFIRRNGADISFSTIVAFGENAAIPHHQTSDQRLKTKDLILLDFGVKIDNYCSDMTRTVFLGRATTEQKIVYETVLNGQQKAMEYIQKYCHSERSEESPTNVGSRIHERSFSRSNRDQDDIMIKAMEVDRVARQYIISQGYPSIPHSLGHGIGLEVHEPPSLSPVSKQFLSDGMVFSIEPGIYLPGKLGVRIEDLFAIKNDKLQQLTKSSQKLIEIF